MINFYNYKYYNGIISVPAVNSVLTVFKLGTEQKFRLEQKLLQWGLLVSDIIGGGVVQTEND